MYVCMYVCMYVRDFLKNMQKSDIHSYVVGGFSRPVQSERNLKKKYIEVFIFQRASVIF